MATSNTTPIVIPQPIAAQATSENINVIPNGATGTNKASFQEGFPEITRMPVIENPLPTQKSGLPPTQQDFNGLFNAVSQHNFFAQNGGMYSFNQAVSDAIGGYPKNAVLWYFPENENPCLVYSLINDNTNNFVEDPTLIDDEHWKKLSFGGSGEIGDIGFAPLGIDESENKRRYLNGQVIIQSQFVSFTNKVKAAIALYPSLATTETNWQAEKTNSKLGQCGKFVVDDTAGTIRLPCVVNAQGLVDLALIGGIKSESLPNITGNISGIRNLYNTGTTVSGAFSKTAHQNDITGNNITQTAYDLSFNASRSSSTYQNNAPVQQEAVQYPYYIVVNTGVEEAERPINNYQVNNVYSYGMSQYYKGTMNNNSWLRSQGQWNDGTVYTGMYNWLLEQMNAGVSGFVASTATYTDYDFVINTADQTFRLPLLDGSEDLPSDRYDNLTISATTQRFTAPANGIYTISGVGLGWVDIENETSGDFGSCSQPRTSDGFGRYTLKAKRGDQIAIYCGAIPSSYVCRFIYAKGNGNLYYYVGDTLQNADLINVARIEEKLTDVNAASRGYVVDSYHNGTEWYRIYSDGWCEQGGRLYNNADVANTIYFLKPYADTNYNVIINHGVNGYYSTNIWGRHGDEPFELNTTYFKAWTYSAVGINNIIWEAKGYIR